MRYRKKALRFACGASLLVAAPRLALAQPAEKMPAAVPITRAARPVTSTKGPVPAPRTQASSDPGLATQATQATRHTLANGVTVTWQPLSWTPVVAVTVTIAVGTATAPIPPGLAKLFEQLVDGGSARVAQDGIASFAQQVGASNEVSVDEDGLHLQLVVPVGYWKHALALQADRLASLRISEASLRQALATQQEQVRSNANDALARAYQALVSRVFADTPLGVPVYGTKETLARITLADANAFWRRQAVASNVHVAIVGDVNEAEVTSAMAESFAKLPATERRDAEQAPGKGATSTVQLSVATPKPPPEAGAESVTTPSGAPQARSQRVELGAAPMGLVMAGWPLPAATHADLLPLQLAAVALATGDHARLRKRLLTPDKNRKILGVDTSATVQLHRGQSLFVALGAFAMPEDIGAVEAALVQEVAALATQPLTASELATAKRQLLATFTFAADGAAGSSSQLGKAWALTGDALRGISDLATVQKLTSADVSRVVRLYLTAGQATVVATPPRAAALATGEKP